MKIIGAVKIGLALAVLLGSLPVVTLLDPSSSVSAATSTTSKDLLQKEIVRAISQRLSSLEVTYTGKETSMKKDIRDSLDAAVYADDYLHYIVKTYGYRSTMSGNKAKIAFSFTYWETLSQTNEVKNRVTQVLRKILTKGMNDHQKEKAIHDWIVTNISYDTRLVSHSAYDGISKGKTVCQGYALLTYEMMKQAGIPVKIMEGTSRGISHTWNLVQIGGKWYHLDTTWDDPVPDIVGRTAYNYYNLTDTQIRPDHKWTSSTHNPGAVSPYDQTLATLTLSDSPNASFYDKLYEQLGYLYLTDAYTATSLQNLTSKLKDAVADRRKDLVIRYTPGTMIKTDMKKAFAALKGVSGFSYSYEDYSRTTINDKLLRITFKYS